MTEIQMRTAGIALHELLGGTMARRDREFRNATRTALEDSGLTVREVFAKKPSAQNVPEISPDGTRGMGSYIVLTIGVDIDADPERIEHACADLTIPGFPATAWKFSED